MVHLTNAIVYIPGNEFPHSQYHQAVWRGRRLRRSLNNKKIAAARKRLHEANQAATDDKKLGNRTSSALDFLLNYKQLSYILDALMHLGRLPSTFSRLSCHL